MVDISQTVNGHDSDPEASEAADPVVDSHVQHNEHTLSKHEAAELEKKGASHMVEIVVIAMLAMNMMFMLYCFFAERVRAKKRRKYYVVSDNDFHFDTVDEKNDKHQLEDISYGQNVNSSNID